MGARHVLDLTSDVTHLICAAVNSPKYKYVAKMRIDVKVLKPKWVMSMYEQWLDGEDINPHEFEREYRFPTLAGLRISVTGVPDVAERKRIEEFCVSQAATYHPDLTKQVTHLIAAAPTGKKYEFALHNCIKVVAPEWLTDSLQRGMALDEDFYSPNLPPEKIGIGAKPAQLIKQVDTVDYRWKRKIRKTMEDELGSQSHHIWDDIIGHASTLKAFKKRDEWQEHGKQEDDTDDISPVVRRRNIAVAAHSHKPNQMKKNGLFAGICFFVWGFNPQQTNTLRSVIEGIDGTIVLSATALELSKQPRQFTIVPRATSSRDYPSMSCATTLVTDWWLEQCMHYNTLVEPIFDDITTIPIAKFPLDGFQNMDICITQFTGIDLLHWGKLIPLAGANLHETLTKKISLLIVRSTPGKGAKFLYAISQDIPVVTSDWLLACIRQQRKVPLDSYRIYEKLHPMGCMPVENRTTPQKIIVTNSMLGDRFNKRKAGLNAAEGEHSPDKRYRSAEPQHSLGAGFILGNEPQQSIFGVDCQRNGECKNAERKILHGCNLHISKQLKDRADELRDVAKSLGAAVIDKYKEDDSLTHLLYSTLSGSLEDMTKDFHCGTKIGCMIVSPEWLYKCQEIGQRVDEKAFPPVNLGISELDIPVAGQSYYTMSSLPPAPCHFQPISNNSSLTSRPTALPGFGTLILPNIPSIPISQSTTQGHSITSPSGSTTPPSICSNRRVAPSSSTIANVGLGEVLTKFGPKQLASALDAPRKPRSRLQGKAVPGTNRGFSRTPSFTGDQGSVASTGDTTSSQVVASQGLKYNDDDAENERKIVRQKLGMELDQLENHTEKTNFQDLGFYRKTERNLNTQKSIQLRRRKRK